MLSTTRSFNSHALCETQACILNDNCKSCTHTFVCVHACQNPVDIPLRPLHSLKIIEFNLTATFG